MYEITDEQNRVLYASPDVLQIDTIWDFLTMKEEALKEKYRHLGEKELAYNLKEWKLPGVGTFKLKKTVKFYQPES